MNKFKESDLERYNNFSLPPDWSEVATNSFNKYKNVTHMISKDNLEDFLEVFLADCPDEMRLTMPSIEEFMNRYSKENSNSFLSKEEFDNVWRETYYIKKEFESYENS